MELTKKNSPFETEFYLGRSYHLNEEFDKAIAKFELFKKEAGPKHFLRKEADLDIQYAKNAQLEIAQQKRYRIRNIGTPINSEFSDFSPVITTDENALFFTSRRLRVDTSQPSNKGIFSPQDGKHFEDVYVSYKDRKTKKWSKPQLMEFSSPRSNQATISVSADGQTLFIYKDDNGDGNIYISTQDENGYGRPKKMGPNINTPDSWETHATISADGKTLYFVSDKEDPNAMGGRDIYRCVKLPNGEWSKATNLGAPINTPYDEDSPFFHGDGSTMYFSSNNDRSMGGFDIFVTQKQPDGNWSQPENLGYPLNSVDDDVFFTTSADGKRGYYSSAHGKDGHGEKDIYAIELDTIHVEEIAILKGYIDPGVEPELPRGIVIWVTDNTEGADPLQYRPNRKTGSYVFNLIPCHEYFVEYTLDDEAFYETEFKVPCNSGFQEINKVISLGGVLLNEEDPIEQATAEEKANWKYQILLDGKPYTLGGAATLAAASGSQGENGEIIREIITESGTFRYKELPGEKDPIFELEVTDPSLCDKFTINILDKDGNVIKVTKQNILCKVITTDIVAVSFERFYGYNEKGRISEAKKYKEFLTGIKKIIETKGNAVISIEASASKVPTSSFSNNQDLSNKRLKDAQELLMKKMKKSGINLKQIKWKNNKALVQGPSYGGDPQNTEKYGPYQYVKISAK